MDFLKNWKTLLAGIVAAAPQFMVVTGIPLDGTVGAIINLVGMLLLGYNAADAKKTPKV